VTPLFFAFRIVDGSSRMMYFKMGDIACQAQGVQELRWATIIRAPSGFTLDSVGIWMPQPEKENDGLYCSYSQTVWNIEQLAPLPSGGLLPRGLSPGAAGGGSQGSAMASITSAGT